MGKSWFYLTLWRGTPPEMTEFVDAELDTAEHPGAEIATEDAAAGNIERTTSGNALIDETSSAQADITTRTEVVWYVGRIQP